MSRPTTAPFGILVMDDHVPLLDRVRARLTAEGWSVVATSQTVGAARHLVACDLVLLDFHMPGIDGASVLDSLRAAARRSGAAPLFYLYTSDAANEDGARGLGFDGAITNKGDEETLVAQVRAIERIVRLRKLSTRGPNSQGRS